METADLICFLV